jgi:hypothetical protein
VAAQVPLVLEPAAHGHQVLAHERRMQAQQAGASPLDRGEVDLRQFLADVFGVELGIAGGAGQGLDERRPGREVLAWRLDEAIVRIVTARPGLEPISEAMAALAPWLIRDAKPSGATAS